MLKNAKQPGKERERDFAQVGVDMSPPEIRYEIVKTASGRNTGELKIVVTDKQSGVDPSKTFFENINPGAEAGVPIVQGGPIPKTQTEKKLVWLYQLLIPTFTPTEQNESSFSILSESETSAENMPREFADFIAYNPASLKSTSKVSSPADFVIKKPTNPNSKLCDFQSQATLVKSIMATTTFKCPKKLPVTPGQKKYSLFSTKWSISPKVTIWLLWICLKHQMLLVERMEW